MATNSTESLARIQTTPYADMEEQIRSGEAGEDLRAVFGDELAGELEDMARTTPPPVLGPADRPLVVVLPGIMGSTLANTRDGTDVIWLNPVALLAGKLRLLRLGADGARSRQGTAIAAQDLVPLIYLPLRLHLRFLGGCDVRAFPYDWRLATSTIAEDLGAFLRDLAAREGHGRKIHLVCHSMGGVVARTYCLRNPDEAESLVAQVIMLGTPNHGSYEAVRNLTVGSDMIQMIQRLSKANEAPLFARSIPGLYHLLPAPTDAYPADAPERYPFDAGFNVYDQAAYQAEGLSARHMAAARDAYRQLAAARPSRVPVTVIAGVGLATCGGLQKQTEGAGSTVFDFQTHLVDGDGTVPLASVTGIPYQQRFLVPQGKHSDLPSYKGVRAAVASLVHGEGASLPQELAVGLLDGEAAVEKGGVPEAPLPGELGHAEIDAIAARVRTGVATPEELAALGKLV